jgi:hypothetical protein
MKVAIVCGSPSSEFLAPFDNKGWEIWVLGNRINRFKNKRITRIFEIHDDLSEHGDTAIYANMLANLKIPMVVGRNFPIAQDHIKIFPFEDVERLYGQTYLTSSSAYMMALALLEGATDIAIYGVDMAVDDHEYFWQRPCMEAWIGFAKGRGVNIIIPEIATIGKCDYVEGKNYGGKPKFKQPPFTEEEFSKMADEHQRKIDDLQNQIDNLISKIHAHNGAKQVYQRLAKVSRATESGIKFDSLFQTNLIK